MRDRKVIVELRGGLGNQLFQYAAARAIAIRNDVPLYVDGERGFENDPYRRQYALAPFRIQAEPLPANERPPRRLRARVFEILEKAAMRGVGRTFWPAVRHWQVRSVICLRGYFQSPLYFEDVQQQVREELQLIETPVVDPGLTRALAAPHTVSVHVRRQHGAAEGRSFGLRAAYYDRALRALSAAAPISRVFAFGDDPAWLADATEVASRYQTTTIRTGSDIADFFLMQQCHHHVIANSTFSWWAAWLGHKAGQLVVAPDNFSPRLAKRYRHVYPEDWLTVPVR